MKKYIAIVVLLISVTIFSQNELNVGINGGITTGNLKPISSSAFGLDANYLFDWFQDFKVGPSLGLVYFATKGEEVNAPDSFMYLPIGASAQFQAGGDAFYAGVDLGFAVGLSPDGDNGGVYLRPMIGYNVSNAIKLGAFYSVVKKRLPSYTYVGLGISFNILSGGDDMYSSSY